MPFRLIDYSRCVPHISHTGSSGEFSKVHAAHAHCASPPPRPRRPAAARPGGGAAGYAEAGGAGALGSGLRRRMNYSLLKKNKSNKK